MLRMRLSRRCVGVDDHIDPAGCTDFTEIQCEFDGTQWGSGSCVMRPESLPRMRLRSAPAGSRGIRNLSCAAGRGFLPRRHQRTRRGHAGGSVQNLHSSAWGPPTSFHDREKEPSAHTRACFPSRGTRPALQTKNLTPLPPPALSRSQERPFGARPDPHYVLPAASARPPPVRMPRRTLFRPAPRQ